MFFFIKLNALFSKITIYKYKNNLKSVNFLMLTKDFLLELCYMSNMSDKLLDMIWKLDIEKMNDHLPANRKTLRELLAEDKPIVMTKKDKPHKIRKPHLEIVSELFDESEWDNVKLPIVLLRRTNLAKGIYSISGGLQEIYIIHRIIGRTTNNYSTFILEDHEPYIWKPEAFTAARKITSIVIIGYT